jgi:hypothetical protein
MRLSVGFPSIQSLHTTTGKGIRAEKRRGFGGVKPTVEWQTCTGIGTLFNVNLQRGLYGTTLLYLANNDESCFPHTFPWAKMFSGTFDR